MRFISAKLLIIAFSSTSVYFMFVAVPSFRQYNPLSECQDYPIHILTMSTSLEDTRSFPLQLKSILYHRCSPVVLHLFVKDDLVRNVYETLLNTWQADQVYYEIYQLKESTEKVTMSAFVEAARELPNIVKQVVYLAPNIVFTSDVREWLRRCQDSDRYVTLWMNDIGCNMTDVELCNEMTDVAIINVDGSFREKSSDIDFFVGRFRFFPCHLTLLTSESLRNGSRCFQYFLTAQSTLLFLVKNEFSEELLGEEGILKFAKDAIQAIEASGPRNRLQLLESKLLEEDYFDNLSDNISFKSLSPQEEGFGNISFIPRRKDSVEVFCNKLLRETRLKRVTHIFYHYGEEIRKLDQKGARSIEVTLLTALTLDRWSSLEMMLTHWSGPAGVLFYLTDSEATLLPKLMKSSSVLNSKKVKDRIAIHLVFKTTTFNPINYLRNVLLNNSHTSHNVYIDVDLVPNPGIHGSIKKKLNDHAKDSNVLFIIPAFQAFVSLATNFPKNKTMLLKLMKENTVTGYESSNKRALGHITTNYDKWMNATEPYEAAYIRYFEPYAIVPRSLDVRFNEDLLERMQDKIAYVAHLKALNFKFFVLPGDFIIHIPHPPSQGRKIFFGDSRFARCDQIRSNTYRAQILKKYPKAKI